MSRTVTVMFMSQQQTIFKDVKMLEHCGDLITIEAAMEGQPFETTLNASSVLMVTDWPDGLPDFMKTPKDVAQEAMDMLFKTDKGVN